MKAETWTPADCRELPMATPPGVTGEPDRCREDRAVFTPPKYAPPRSGTETVVDTRNVRYVGNCSVMPPCCAATGALQALIVSRMARLRNVKIIAFISPATLCRLLADDFN